MKAFVSSSRFVLARPFMIPPGVVAAVSLFAIALTFGFGNTPSASAQQDPGKVPPVGQPQQPGDDVARELDPIKKRTAEDEKNTDAKA